MLCRKDVSGVLAPVLPCILIAGCMAGGDQVLQSVGQPHTRPAFAAQAQAAPELRIPVVPAEVKNGAGDNLLKQASAQAPVKPPTAVEDSSGPPLKADPPPAPAVLPADKLRTLHREAAARYAAVDSYIVRMRRREQVGGRDKPEEILYVRFRKQPWSIYFKWLGKEANGREVIYVKGQYEDKIHTLLAAGDMPFMPAGKRIALAPDSSLVRTSSRYSINEAGIGVLINKFGAMVDAADRGDNRFGTLRYLGLMKRAEFEAPCEATEQEIRPGLEALLPRGGRRLWLFDPSGKFPVPMTAQDETGHEVEYYCYDRFQFPVRLDNDDFNPDKLWSPKKPGSPKSDPR